MADESLKRLCRVLTFHPDVLQDPSRLDAALRREWATDLYQVDALVAAYRAGVTSGVIQSRDHRRSPTRQALWRERLEQEMGMDSQLARWAILLWAEALEGVASAYIPVPVAAPPVYAPPPQAYASPAPPPPAYYPPAGQAPAAWQPGPPPPVHARVRGAGPGVMGAHGGFACPRCGSPAGVGVAALQAMKGMSGGSQGVGCIGCLVIVLLVILLGPVLAAMGLIGGLGLAVILVWAQQNMGLVILFGSLVIGAMVLAAVTKPNRLCTLCGHRWRA